MKNAPSLCIHGRAKCPACSAFLTLVVHAAKTARKGDQPWTKTFGNLNRASGSPTASN